MPRAAHARSRKTGGSKKARARAIDLWGEEGAKLYRRYQSMRGKALAAGIPFQWSTFDAFMASVLRVKEDYHPRYHRFKFNLDSAWQGGIEGGYSERTLGFAPTALAPKPVSQALLAQFQMAEIVRMLLEPGEHDLAAILTESEEIARITAGCVKPQKEETAGARDGVTSEDEDDDY